MSCGVKTTCFKAPGVSLGGSGVSIGVRILREQPKFLSGHVTLVCNPKHVPLLNHHEIHVFLVHKGGFFWSDYILCPEGMYK